jgi:YidC/Oxa1 family membrane protein insertase
VNADLVSAALWPLEWLVEALLVGCHGLLTVVGLPAAAGPTWLLAVLCLVIIVRILLTPLFIRQVRSQRAMADLAPRLRTIEETYKGKHDQVSREAMSRETMDLYQRSGTSPFASCLLVLIPAPIVLSLFLVLKTAMRSPGQPGVGFLTAALSASFGHATLFGAPLRFTLLTPGAPPTVLLIGLTMIAIMAGSQYLTQLVNMRSSTDPGTVSARTRTQQIVLLYALPLVFVVSGIAFPLGVLTYWTFSNLWTLAQTHAIDRPERPPGKRTGPDER